MTVIQVDLIRAELPFHAPFRIAISESSSTTNIFVRIHTDTGLVGWGEGSPSPAITGDSAETMLAAGGQMGRMVLGQDPGDIEGLVARLTARLRGHTTIRSAFDMALHDVAAQAAGLPLYGYLGGGRRAFETDNTVGMDTPRAMAETADRFRRQGFRSIKAKVGSGLVEDVARIRAIREAVGPDTPLRIDANQGWDPATAIGVLGEVQELGIEYCEQPVARHDVTGMRRVREAVAVPIMADESVFDHYDALRLARAEACDFLNIKLSKSGGIRTALRIAAVAEAAGMACMVGCMSETRLGLTAAAHFISARSVVRFADLDSHVDHTVDPVVGGLQIEDGQVHLPDAPGIGAHLSDDYLAGCRVERITA